MTFDGRCRVFVSVLRFEARSNTTARDEVASAGDVITSLLSHFLSLLTLPRQHAEEQDLSGATKASRSAVRALYNLRNV